MIHSFYFIFFLRICPFLQAPLFFLFEKAIGLSVVDLGGTRDASPSQNFIISKSVMKIGQIVCWSDPQGLVSPLGNPIFATGFSRSSEK